MGSFRANWVKKSKQYSEEEIDASRETNIRKELGIKIPVPNNEIEATEESQIIFSPNVHFAEDTTTKSSSKDYSFLFEKPSITQEEFLALKDEEAFQEALNTLVEEELRPIVEKRKQSTEDINPIIPEYDWNVGFTTTSGSTTTATPETVYIDLDSNLKQKYSITEEDLRKYSEMYNAFGKMAKQKSQKKSYTDYVLVLWPESESILSKPWFGDCILMNDKSHLGRIGSSAYFVPKELYETLNLTKNGKETTES